MPHVPDLSGSALDDRYELHAVIGEGAFGRVYEGRDRRLERPVAVKVIKPWWAEDPEWVTDFERETRLLARISDSGIVQIYDVGHAPEGRYYVSELVSGENLAQRLRRGSIAPWQAAGIAAQLCRALASAHAQRIVHRDVKPPNILLSSSGRVKVGDFGVAGLAEGSSGAGSQTIVGTPSYMAPEQSRGRPVSPATDVYSAGVVLYEMVAGVLPFSAGSAVELAVCHLQDPPPPLPASVPEPLRQIIVRALAKDPAQRYIDGGEMADALVDASRRASERARERSARSGGRGRLRVPHRAADRNPSTAVMAGARAVPSGAGTAPAALAGSGPRPAALAGSAPRPTAPAGSATRPAAPADPATRPTAPAGPATRPMALAGPTAGTATLEAPPEAPATLTAPAATGPSRRAGAATPPTPPRRPGPPTTTKAPATAAGGGPNGTRAAPRIWPRSEHNPPARRRAVAALLAAFALVGAMIAAAIVLGHSGSGAAKRHVVPKIEVPNVTGLSTATAEARLKRSHLRSHVVTVPWPGHAAGTVRSQSPVARRVKRRSIVTLNVAEVPGLEDPRPVQLDDLAGVCDPGQPVPDRVQRAEREGVHALGVLLAHQRDGHRHRVRWHT